MSWVTSLILLMAILALRMSQWATGGQWFRILSWTAIQFAILWGLKLTWRISVRRRSLMAKPTVAILVLGGIFCAVTVAVGGGWDAHSVEEQLVIVLMSIAVGLFVFQADGRTAGQATMISSIAVISLLPTLPSFARTPLIIAMLLLSSVWLWTTSARIAVLRHWFWPALGMGTVLLSCAASHQWIQPTDGNPWYAAWVPSSGGDGDGSESARRGVGDGPDEISSGQATSIGFDQSDNFSESAKDGLYDLWIEAYGEPVKPGESQKMVGLKPNDVNVVRAPDRENLKVGRRFEMNRRPTTQPQPRSGPDTGASARVWVKGPMPVYLRLATFDTFDGAAWSEEAHGQPSVPARVIDGWFEVLNRPISPAFSGVSEHQIRVGDFGGTVLPLPPITERFRMGRVAKPDFFSATRPGMIRLSRRTVPPGATLDARSKQIDPARLAGVHPALPQHAGANYLNVAGIDPRLARFASEWAAPHSRGWRQIQAVVNELRRRVRVDKAPADHRSSSPLLLGDEVGTDYEIASVACLMLRKLSYPTRLVSGLYADESHVDRSSGYAGITAQQAHFWIEVQLADGTWVSIDPTPGFPVLNIPRSPSEWASDAWFQVRTGLMAHWLVATPMFLACIAVFICRKTIIDAIVTAYCRWRGCPVLHTVRVLELRSRLAGCPRPAHVPMGNWLKSIASDSNIRPFIAACNQAMYSHATLESVGETSRDALRTITRASLQKAGKPTR
jgi:protein-glutamine gamma-glutamyltransferase